MIHPRLCNAKPNFYPRSPCGERQKGSGKSTTLTNFYPRSPCGERPPDDTDNAAREEISIHALLAESDAPGSL